MQRQKTAVDVSSYYAQTVRVDKETPLFEKKDGEYKEIGRIFKGTVLKLDKQSAQNMKEKYRDFHFGEFIEKPNQCGCFERNGNWYTYVIDEKNFCTFGGPYSRNGIICACIMILPITMVKEQYNFTEEEFNIYLHNHFHSLEEIDKNVNSNKA